MFIPANQIECYTACSGCIEAQTSTYLQYIRVCKQDTADRAVFRKISYSKIRGCASHLLFCAREAYQNLSLSVFSTEANTHPPGAFPQNRG